MVLKAVPDTAPDLLGALYGRQSKSNKESIAEQFARLRSVCSDEGWGVFAEYEDGVSASRFTTKRRQDWSRLLDDLRAGRFQILLLWESSRGDRDLPSWVALLALCRETGVKIYVDTHERLYDMRNARDWKILVEDGTDSAYESEKTSLRWRRKTAARAEAGLPHGFVPYGWSRRAVLDDQGQVIGSEDILNPAEAAAVRDAAQAFLDGESLRSIVARLNKSGSLSPRGVPWSSQTLKQILRRKRNAGLRVHQGRVIGRGQWEPIYDEDIHIRIEAKLDDPTRGHNKGSEIRHQGTGIFRCGLCWATRRGTMRHVRIPAKDGRQPIEKYQCKVCMRIARKQEPVDQLVDAVIIARLSRPDAMELLATGDPGRARELRDQIDTLEARLLTFADQAADGSIDPPQLARINAKLRPQIEAARSELVACQPHTGVMRLVGPDAAEKWRAAPLSLRRAVIAALVEVTILPSKRGAKFRPEEVRIEWRRRVTVSGEGR